MDLVKHLMMYENIALILNCGLSWLHLLILNLVTSSLDPRVSPAGFYNQKEICVFGGKTLNGLQNDLWCFNVGNMRWREIM